MIILSHHNPSSWLLKVVRVAKVQYGILERPPRRFNVSLPAGVRELSPNVHLDESVAPLPQHCLLSTATLHLSDLVRAQLKQSHVVCDRYLASPLSLMIAESAIDETEARRLMSHSCHTCACPI